MVNSIEDEGPTADPLTEGLERMFERAANDLSSVPINSSGRPIDGWTVAY
jgi:hypothetical protein